MNRLFFLFGLVLVVGCAVAPEVEGETFVRQTPGLSLFPYNTLILRDGYRLDYLLVERTDEARIAHHHEGTFTPIGLAILDDLAAYSASAPSTTFGFCGVNDRSDVEVTFTGATPYTIAFCGGSLAPDRLDPLATFVNDLMIALQSCRPDPVVSIGYCTPVEVD
jgi:hypothetical protein